MAIAAGFVLQSFDSLFRVSLGCLALKIGNDGS